MGYFMFWLQLTFQDKLDTVTDTLWLRMMPIIDGSSRLCIKPSNITIETGTPMLKRSGQGIGQGHADIVAPSIDVMGSILKHNVYALT
jgi:hypothetical protein